MEDNLLVILGSARKDSDTRHYIDLAFKETEYTVIDLLDYPITPYSYNGTYPESDKFSEVVDYMLSHQRIVFATPVYWYAMSGLMKTLFDRFTDLITIYKPRGRQLKGKATFLFAVGAERDLPEGFHFPFQATSDYLKMSYLGGVYYSKKFVSDPVDFSGMQQLFGVKNE